jgi:outer membrane receptor for ferrienterochelin and colicins
MRMPILPRDFRPEYSPWYTLLHLQFSLQVNENLGLKIGVRNLLNFLPQHPVMRPFDPFDRTAANQVTNPNGYTFDASYSYAPLISRRLVVSISYRLSKK